MNIGAVVIGRNEGERLRMCLKSIVKQVDKVVYVDSGSTDGSANMAAMLGAVVVELDMNRPFTAARARNEGLERLHEVAPGLAYVQFVDGDCEVVPGWLEQAALFLGKHVRVAAVCGRLRERYPERSVYNMLCDWEWDTPVGEAKACGGNAMFRVDVLFQAGKFRDDLIAGEEPELCVRLRALGWHIWRLDVEMALHDAAITRFGQWWKRAKRSGFAYAQGAHLHGAPPERHGVKESRGALVWGLIIPITVGGLTFLYGGVALSMLLIYPLQLIRLAMRGNRSVRENWWRALFLVLGKFPEVVGQMSFLYIRLAGKVPLIIEYK